MLKKIDEYGREYIAAPKGKVLKAYLVYDWGHMEHCLIDEWGLVFRSRGMGGWMSLQQADAAFTMRLIVLPNPVERGNEFNNKSWSWEDWYERNWLCDSWAWMYSKASQFRDIDLSKLPVTQKAFRRQKPTSGSGVIYLP